MKPKAINIVMTKFQDTEDKLLAFNCHYSDDNTKYFFPVLLLQIKRGDLID